MPGAADHNAEDRDASTDGCSYTKEDVTETLQSIVTTLMGFYDTDPVEFGKAVEAANRNVGRLQTASSVVSALYNFGKKPGAMALSFHGRNCATIPVQPTAVARRKSVFGG